MTVSARASRRLHSNVSKTSAGQNSSIALYLPSSRVAGLAAEVAEKVAESARQCAEAVSSTWGAEAGGKLGELLHAARTLRLQLVSQWKPVNDTCHAIDLWQGVTQTQQATQAVQESAKRIRHRLDRARTSNPYIARRTLTFAIRELLSLARGTEKAHRAAEKVASVAIDSTSLLGVYSSLIEARHLIENAQDLIRATEAPDALRDEASIRRRAELIENRLKQTTQLAQQAISLALLAAMRGIPSRIADNRGIPRQESMALGLNLQQAIAASRQIAVQHQAISRARQSGLKTRNPADRKRDATAIAEAARQLLGATREAIERIEHGIQLTIALMRRDGEKGTVLQDVLIPMRDEASEARRAISGMAQDTEILDLMAQNTHDLNDLHKLINSTKSLEQRSIQIGRQAVQSCQRVLRLLISSLAASAAEEAAKIVERHAFLVAEVRDALQQTHHAVDAAISATEKALQDTKSIASVTASSRGTESAQRTQQEIAQKTVQEQRVRRQVEMLIEQLTVIIEPCQSAAKEARQQAAAARQTEAETSLATASAATQAASQALDLARRANRLMLESPPLAADLTGYAAESSNLGSVAAEIAADSVAQADKRQLASRLETALQTLTGPPPDDLDTSPDQALGPVPEAVSAAAMPEAAISEGPVLESNQPATEKTRKQAKRPPKAFKDPRWPRPDMVGRYVSTRQKFTDPATKK